MSEHGHDRNSNESFAVHIQPAGRILYPLINNFLPRIDVKSFHRTVGSFWWKFSPFSCFSTTKKGKKICINNNISKQDSNCKLKCRHGLCSIGWCFCNIIFLVALGFDLSYPVVVEVNHILRNTFKELYGGWLQCFRRCVNEIWALLGFYTAQNCSFYRHFGTTYRSHLQESSSSSWTAWGWNFQISREPEHECCKVVSHTYRQPLPCPPPLQEIFPVPVSVTNLSRPHDHSVAGTIN